MKALYNRIMNRVQIEKDQNLDLVKDICSFLPRMSWLWKVATALTLSSTVENLTRAMFFSLLCTSTWTFVTFPHSLNRLVSLNSVQNSFFMLETCRELVGGLIEMDFLQPNRKCS